MKVKFSIIIAILLASFTTFAQNNSSDSDPVLQAMHAELERSKS